MTVSISPCFKQSLFSSHINARLFVYFSQPESPWRDAVVTERPPSQDSHESHNKLNGSVVLSRPGTAKNSIDGRNSSAVNSISGSRRSIQSKKGKGSV